jgi:hypothetical protein
MATRIGVVVKVTPEDTPDSYAGESLLVRAVKSSDKRELQRMVWLTELDRVVKISAGIQ